MTKTYAAATQEKIAEYVHRVFSPEDPVLVEIRQRADAAGVPAMQVAPMDGLHLEVLARALNAHNVVEIGTLAGYSGVCLARGIGDHGRLYTFEYDPKHAAIAEESFKKAKVSDRVKLFVGPALERLCEIEGLGPFDLIFIDADKVSYPQYLKWADENLRIGGAILADNTFGWGGIADDIFEDAEHEACIRALQAFNLETAHGGRFRTTILPTGEGLSLGVKIR